MMENIRSHQLKVNQLEGMPPEEPRNIIIPKIILTKEFVKEQFNSRVVYDVDLMGHSSLLVEGLLLKYSNNFFE